MSLSLHEQLKLHMEDREENNKIWPHDCWTIEEYKEFFRYVDDGWLIQSDYYSGHNAFVIDEEWEDDPPCPSHLWVDDMKCPTCGDIWTDYERCDCPPYEDNDSETDSAFGTEYHDGSGYADCDPYNTGYRKCRSEGDDKKRWCSECVYINREN